MKLLKTFIASALISSCFFCSLTNVYAVEDQFQINLSVTAPSDTTAPSVPTGLSATAVSSNQIDLSWNASTDNVAVTGYRIYRDNAFVGSASGLTYSDTGLSASTLYSYVVSAIDAASNESARSSTSTATTLAAPVVSSGGGGSSGQNMYPIIYDLRVIPTEHDAVISWKTTQPTVGTISWGQSSNLEIGSLSEIVYSTVHQITLPNLSAGTTYLFSLDVLSGYGTRATLTNQTFSTNPISEYGINAISFKAIPDTKSILLSWKNPTSLFFEEVRVVRGNGFYPNDPNDGTVIYEGKGESFVDEDVVIGDRYYYALFAKDTKGSYSSGLLATARIPKVGEATTPELPVFDNLPKAPNVHPVIEALSFVDFDFIQEGKRIATFTSGESVTIDGSKNLTISLDYKKVPEVLKSIVVTLSHPTDQSQMFSFLLRANEDRTAYTATIGPLGESGKYGVDIAIVDFKNQGLKKIVGNLYANVTSAYEQSRGFFSLLYIYVLDRVIYILILILILLLILKALKLIFGSKNKVHTTAKQ